MHIVLSGYYGFDNVGDEAILYAIISTLKNIEPDIRITVLSNQPEKTADLYKVEAANRWKIREVNQVIKHSDGLISGGGSLLQDQTGIKSIPYYIGVIKMAQWHRVPVFVYAQGMGPIQHKHNQWIVKRVLNKVKGLTVRDENSKFLLKNIGVKQTINVAPDPVIGLDGSVFRQTWLTISGQDAAERTAEVKQRDRFSVSGSIIAVSVRDWPSDIPYKQYIASCLDELVRDGYNVLFIPMHGQVDEVCSQETANLMQETSLIAPGDLSIEEKIALIGESKLLIGVRLHSLIFAAIVGTPFIGLSYDPKIDAFADIFEQSVAGHINSDEWDADTLLRLVQNLMNDYNKHYNMILKKARKSQQEAIQTAHMALDTFKNRHK